MRAKCAIDLFMYVMWPCLTFLWGYWSAGGFQ